MTMQNIDCLLRA